MVIKSANTWQGCSSSVNPFIIGIDDTSARVSTPFCEKVLIIIPSKYLDNTLAVSWIGSPRPICKSFELKNRGWPPSSYIPTSKDTLVRVDAFSNIIPNDLPLSKWCSIPCLFSYFNWSARFKISNISSFDKLSIRNKSFFIKKPPLS